MDDVEVVALGSAPADESVADRCESHFSAIFVRALVAVLTPWSRDAAS